MDYIIDEMQVPVLRRIGNMILKCLCCGFICWKKKGIDPNYLNGKRLKVERAAEPLDIFWENLGIGRCNRTFRILLTYFVTFVCLIISFGINVGMNAAKNAIETASQEANLYASFASGWGIRIV
jgi:hypothetical protein